MSKAIIDYRSLAISERIELVEEIWDSIAEETSVDTQLSPERRAELHRRLAAHRADPSSSIPWEEVREKLFNSQS
ncbi:MAG: addiction module protein [Nitrococcus sp.]|nr:addiction module protein [Nitrococcus sp.]